MRAAILQRDHRAVQLAEEDEVLAEQCPRERRAAHLVVPGRDVPVVTQEHSHLHGGRRIAALRVQQAVDQTPRLERAIVVADVEQRGIRLEIEHPLLPGEHRDILADHLVALAMELGDSVGVVRTEVMGDRPEIVRGAVRRRGDAMAYDELPSLLAALVPRGHRFLPWPHHCE